MNTGKPVPKEVSEVATDGKITGLPASQVKPDPGSLASSKDVDMEPPLPL